MSLKVGPRPDREGIWITGTVTPAASETGVRVRRRAGSDSLKLAKEEAAALEAQILKNAWHGLKLGANHTFGDACVSYLKHEPRSNSIQAGLARLVQHFGDVPLAAIDQKALEDARDKLFPNASPATVKRWLFTPVQAVLNFASHPSREMCAPPRFDPPADKKKRTEFLMPAEVERIIACSNRARLSCSGSSYVQVAGFPRHSSWSGVT